MTLIDSLTPGQWLVLASFLGAAFCAKPVQKTALWFSSLFAANYIWLKWTELHLDVNFYGFHLLRIAAELIIILAILRHANKLSRWLVWLEVGMIAACIVAMAAPLADWIRAIYPYKKATILALESLQVFGVFFCVSPLYSRFVEPNGKKEESQWLARSMTHRHI